jgi:type II secretory pathway pseudopilin PulG
MKLDFIDQPKRRRSGATLLEVVFAMGIVGISFLALYSGLTYGFARVQFSRENHRATQILIEKMETIRLYNWDQITSTTYIPQDFAVNYYPNASGEGQGVLYTGKLEIDKSDLKTNYEDDIKKITVTLTWTSGKIKRSRSLTTYACEFGLHKSVY